ncbi:hypothetical protein H103_08581 [Trichophyton rubrum CBS 288.86]|uniref:Uncharacterized protein n=1 Tax=Trichophyton rubrum CBS 288.86 TaxID=1215330 RepID=A0A022VNC2_TRIRU|nr:hypothetical protein H100_08599 [Trichophyton rubrum MR850]EZF36959.1 hypothetical protein H102_08558 [Trichophyton rubrum CBS 100081]EZF47575.1 hypothetical protein H103_08581 [Trichophyton rubrum CBS 288.86]EZF58251.1 hypothetical protein H104_08533 [Trichophyton rubrum CBS 289.86]EZF79472.1 hypothetical protein H110_08582 [Trichophyton rubrum MR1448]EZG11742.1 hypothetical protein H107_08737 [Trichophyton rubrum CBS 202.88]
MANPTRPAVIFATFPSEMLQMAGCYLGFWGLSALSEQQSGSARGLLLVSMKKALCATQATILYYYKVESGNDVARK